MCHDTIWIVLFKSMFHHFKAIKKGECPSVSHGLYHWYIQRLKQRIILTLSVYWTPPVMKLYWGNFISRKRLLCVSAVKTLKVCGLCHWYGKRLLQCGSETVILTELVVELNWENHRIQNITQSLLSRHWIVIRWLTKHRSFPQTY